MGFQKKRKKPLNLGEMMGAYLSVRTYTAAI